MADANRDRSADLARQRSVDAGIIGGSTGLLQQWQQGQQGQQLQASGMANQSQNARIAQALEAGQQRTARASSALGGLTQSARLRGSQNETVNTNLSGKGYQEGSQWNAGGSVGDVCCFIFMESLNGPLPWYVRKGRDDHQTVNGVAGYRWMSNWLIPLMRKYTLVQKVVNATMVKPIMCYGRYKYCGENPRWGWAFKPVLHAWLGVWKTLGGLGYAL